MYVPPTLQITADLIPHIDPVSFTAVVRCNLQFTVSDVALQDLRVADAKALVSSDDDLYAAIGRQVVEAMVTTPLKWPWKDSQQLTP